MAWFTRTNCAKVWDDGFNTTPFTIRPDQDIEKNIPWQDFFVKISVLRSPYYSSAFVKICHSHLNIFSQRFSWNFWNDFQISKNKMSTSTCEFVVLMVILQIIQLRWRELVLRVYSSHFLQKLSDVSNTLLLPADLIAFMFRNNL